MKNIIGSILLGISALTCIFISGYMAINGIPQWDWFIFIGLTIAAITGESLRQKK